jgi:MFS family permease
MYMASIPGVEEHFRVSTTLAISPLSFAALGFFLGPILAVSVSEIYGRIWVYRVTIPVSLAFTMIAGSAQAFRTLIVGRTLASVAISPSVSVAAGVINDLWDVKTERMGTAIMLLFASSIVWATEIGPPSSVAIVNDTGDWRWSFYLTAILLGVCLLTLLAPETYGPEIIRKRDARQGNTTTLPSRGSPYSVLLISTGRALHMISTEPIVRYTTMMAAVYQGVIYCFYVAFPLVFQTAYDFTEYQIGMSFLSLFIGSILGLLVLIMCDKWRYQPAVVQARQTGGTVLPEERLYPAMLAGLMMPVSLFWSVQSLFDVAGQLYLTL